MKMLDALTKPSAIEPAIELLHTAIAEDNEELANQLFTRLAAGIAINIARIAENLDAMEKRS